MSVGASPAKDTIRTLSKAELTPVVQEPGKKNPVIVAGKDVGEVDVDYFLIPVNIRDHEGPLQCSFPVENRLLPQGQRLLHSDHQSEAWHRFSPVV